MYIRCPDYGDFQCYDLGVETVLSQIAQKICANFHKPWWRALKHHLFTAGNCKQDFRELRNIAEGDKRAIPNRQ